MPPRKPATRRLLISLVLVSSASWTVSRIAPSRRATRVSSPMALPVSSLTTRAIRRLVPSPAVARDPGLAVSAARLLRVAVATLVGLQVRPSAARAISRVTSRTGPLTSPATEKSRPRVVPRPA